MDLSHTPQSAAQYQRLRLQAGIAGIGLILLFLWIGTALGMANLTKVLTHWPTPLAFAAVACVLGLIASAIQFPIDLFAMNVEARYGQYTDRKMVSGEYFAKAAEWVVGLTVAGAVLGLVVMQFHSNWYWVAGIAMVALGGLHVAYPVLPAKRAQGDRLPDKIWVEQLKVELQKLGLTLPRLTWIDHGERSLGGGWHGVGSLRTLMLTRSLRQLEPAVAAMLVAREIGHNRLHHQIQSFAVTSAWIVAGIFLTRLFVPGDLLVTNAPALVVYVATVMSTWCWLGLFCLPAMGRRQILAADLFAARVTGSRERSLEMLAALSEYNLPDESLPPTVAWVFHPIPPMEKRRSAIESHFSPSGEFKGA